MEKTPEEKKVEKEIGQMQNRQKILLNRKRTEEHRARMHRLIERGAILEAVFPPVKEMDNEEVFLRHEHAASDPHARDVSLLRHAICR